MRTKKALDLEVGDVVASVTGTATVAAVTDVADGRMIEWAGDRTMKYIEDRAMFTPDMNPTLAMADGRESAGVIQWEIDNG